MHQWSFTIVNAFICISWSVLLKIVLSCSLPIFYLLIYLPILKYINTITWFAHQNLLNCTQWRNSFLSLSRTGWVTISPIRLAPFFIPYLYCQRTTVRACCCVQLFGTLWIVAHQVPLSVGFSRQEYWSGLPCLPPGDLPNPGVKFMSLTSHLRH